LSLLTNELRQWIGREFNYTAPEEIGRASIRYFALAIGDENRLYFDDDYARAAGYRGVIAPPTFICETNQYAHRQPNSDGYIGHSWDLPLTGCRMLRGGHEYELFQPVRPDDRITVSWRLEDISERSSSRSGRMLLVSALGRFFNQRSEKLAYNRETLIFQELESSDKTKSASVPGGTSRPSAAPVAAVVSAPGLPPDFKASESQRFDAIGIRVGQQIPALDRKLDLVRMVAYAGATWDWARLHYDPAFIAERQLRAPLIDGQMLGALISEMLLDSLGPRAFVGKLNFRLRAMAFAGDTVSCTGEITQLAESRDHRVLSVRHRVSVNERLIADGAAEVRLPLL
jgi:acyl dehydratase